jgi:ABC-2 type transport system permease protein
MNLRRVWAMTHKEFLHIIRDPRSLGMAVAIPMLMLVLYGYALTLDVDHVPLVVWDQNRSQVSEDFLKSFTGSRYFTLARVADSYRDVEQAIDSRDAVAAIIIPYNFTQLLSSGRTAPVQFIVDGSDSNTATIVLGYAQAVTLAYSQDVMLADVRRTGGRAIEVPLDVRPRVWFNTELESKNYIVPGLIAVIMMVIAALLTSLTVAREWEGGTMEQLISTPVKGPELIIGKLVPYFVIGMVDVLLAVLMGQFVFDVPLRGSPLLLFGMAAIFMIGTLSLGLLISTVSRTQLMANQLAMILTFLPSFLLSGFIFAVSSMPKPIQVVTYIVPARYFVSILKGIYLKGVGLEILAWPALLLAVFTAAMLLLAIAKFKKRLT